ncbi:MAG TPA: NADH-quinone oxidoreductase subunit A [Gemmatimonadales bacterium]|nr:NADH-quinone oxidoreductase subunit A [Gemmatimonadales bacterium]
MLRAYAVLLLLLAFVIVAGGVMIVLSHFAAPRRPTSVKASPYESGMPPLGDARDRFSVKFYLVAMLFIVFDIETVFLLPWAAIYTGGVANVSTGFLLVEMIVFLVILAVGYVYVWKRGAFQWD